MIFSIVTPSYNQAAFLAQTIESVISQAGDFTIDYVIVDGASTDDSVAIIKRYGDLLERGEWPVACRGITYRWISEKDRGQADALVKGFASAQGEILAWLNSDDTYLPGALERVAAFLASAPEVALVYGAAEYCDTKGVTLGSYRTEKFDLQRLASFNFICQPSAFFRRKAYDAVGGVDPALHYAMDYDLWVRIGRRFRCRYLPELLSRYRLHEASKTVREETLYQNSEEALRVTMKHYHWAPLTRIFNSCRSRCAMVFPGSDAVSRLLVAGFAVGFTLFRSLILNRGVRREDLQLLNRANFRKLFKSRISIMTGERLP